MARMKNSRFAHRYVPPAVFAPILLFVLNFVPSYGVNLADEYINAVMKHGHWKDTAVKIEGGAVRNLMSLFLVNWNTQSKEPIDYTKYMKMQWSA